MSLLPLSKRAQNFIAWYLGIVAVVATFGSGFLIGQTVTAANVDVAGKPKALAATGVVANDHTISRTTDVDFNQFWQVWDEIKQRYVKNDVKETDLFYGALQGLVASLGDPYSVYFPPKPAESFAKSLQGEFSGIGAEVAVKDAQLVIVSPLPGSPAEAAGLLPGDRIMFIDKKPTTGLDVGVAVEMIRGPAGTTTTLTIARAANQKTKDYTIVRKVINVPAVIVAWKGNVAHVRVMQFNQDTVPTFQKYIPEIKAKAKGVIVDVRNNPGGYLESAVALASQWIADGRIVSERFRDGSENVHYTQGSHPLTGVPTVILVNGGSASASEILAGALRDQGAATMMGEKTFGKGSVQDYQEMPDGSALKLTVAEWYTPKGTNINKTGLTPDVIVKQEYEKEKIGQDVMVDKAVQYLKQKTQ